MYRTLFQQYKKISRILKYGLKEFLKILKIFDNCYCIIEEKQEVVIMFGESFCIILCTKNTNFFFFYVTIRLLIIVLAENGTFKNALIQTETQRDKKNRIVTVNFTFSGSQQWLYYLHVKQYIVYQHIYIYIITQILTIESSRRNLQLI